MGCPTSTTPTPTRISSRASAETSTRPISTPKSERALDIGLGKHSQAAICPASLGLETICWASDGELAAYRVQFFVWWQNMTGWDNVHPCQTSSNHFRFPSRRVSRHTGRNQADLHSKKKI